MTTQLPERLRDLADDAPAALTAGRLWQAGRQRHRRRVAVTLALAGCLVLSTALLGLGDWRSRQPEPAVPPPTGPMAVPDRLVNPNPWTPTTRAPGRLVAVFTATRDHFPFGSEQNAVVGVTAGSQAYHFLDLPGRAPDATDVSLAPDGRHLAYWISGRPPRGADLGDQATVGVATLDLLTGVVRRHDLHSPHGLGAQSLTWTDDRTVAVSVMEFNSPAGNSTAGDVPVRLVRVDSSGVRQTSLTDPLDQTISIQGGFGLLTSSRTLHLAGANGGHVRRVRTSFGLVHAAYDAATARLAGVLAQPHGGPTAAHLVVGTVNGGHASLARVPGGHRYVDVLAWVDRQHVVAVRLTHAGTAYDVVDVSTGGRRQLTSKPWYAVQIAADALRSARTVPGIAPPSPWNPQWVALGVLGALVLAGGAGLATRRSRVRG